MKFAIFWIIVSLAIIIYGGREQVKIIIELEKRVTRLEDEIEKITRLEDRVYGNGQTSKH